MAQAERLHSALEGGAGAYLIWNLFYAYSMAEVVRSTEAEPTRELATGSVERFGPRAVVLPPVSVSTLVWEAGGA